LPGKEPKGSPLGRLRPFYKGDIGEEFVRGSKEQGGLITMEDLDRWKVYLEEPVMSTYKGIQVYKLNSWVQGPVMLQALNLLESVDLRVWASTAPVIFTLFIRS